MQQDKLFKVLVIFSLVLVVVLGLLMYLFSSLDYRSPVIFKKFFPEKIEHLTSSEVSSVSQHVAELNNWPLPLHPDLAVYEMWCYASEFVTADRKITDKCLIYFF